MGVNRGGHLQADADVCVSVRAVKVGKESRILSVSDIYSIVGERWKVVEYLAAVYHCCALERRVLEVIYRPSAAYLWAALRAGY